MMRWLVVYPDDGESADYRRGWLDGQLMALCIHGAGILALGLVGGMFVGMML